MGDELRVTQAIRRVKAGGDPDLRALRQQLARTGENQNWDGLNRIPFSGLDPFSWTIAGTP